MNPGCRIGLVMVMGTALGALGSEALHSEAAPPAYLIGQIDVSDPDGYAKEYLPKAREIIKAHGGRLLSAAGAAASGSQVVAVDGEPPKTSRYLHVSEHGGASGLAKRSGIRASTSRW